MKKTIAAILTLCLLGTVVFAGCNAVNKANDSQTSTPVSAGETKTVGKTENVPKAMQKIIKMSDKDLADMFGNIDLCLGDDFMFNEAKELNADQLMTFYIYITQSDEFEKNYLGKFNTKDNSYTIPVSEIQSVLDKYFDGAKFDASKLTIKNEYDKASDKVTINIMGYGGMRFPRVSIKEFLADDTLKVSVDFYTDNGYNDVSYTNIYTIRYSDNGYKYVSIVKK